MTTAHRTDARKLRPSSWAVALGTIISALMSSRPTTRIDTTTVTAVSTASAMLSRVTGMPGRAGVLLVVGDGEEPRAQQPGAEHDDHGQPGEHPQIVAAFAVVMAPKRYAVRLAGVPLGDLAMMHDAGGDAAVEHHGEGDVAARAARGPDQLDGDGGGDRGDERGEHRRGAR